MASDPTTLTTLTKLDELMAAIGGYDDPRRAGAEWKQVFKLLQSTELPSGRVNGVVGMRDMAGLAEMIEQLRAPAPIDTEDVPDPEICKKALRAFRKRLSLTVLDEQSKLGRSPLTKGSSKGLEAVVPPSEWPDAVWQELVRQGKLRYITQGLYALAKE